MQADMPSLHERVQRHDQRVHEIADEYKRRGYKVLVRSGPKSRPEFLKSFEPDIIAEGSDESVVIEVKTRTPDRLAYWRQLSEAIEQHPGWRFELIFEPASDRTLPVGLNREEINAHLETALRLLEDNAAEASLLIMWAATEATLRLIVDTNAVAPPDYRPGTLISRLYTEGFLEREEYDFLLHCMRLRNSVAHGFKAEEVTSDQIQHLYAVTTRMLTEEVGPEQEQSEHAA